MVGEPVEERRGHLGVSEDAGPFGEGQVGGDQDRGALLQRADEVEEQLAASLGEGQVAKLVDNHEIDAAKLMAKATGAPIPKLGVEAVHEIDGAEGEAGKRAFQWKDRPPNDAPGVHGIHADRDRQVRFAGAGAAFDTTLRVWSMKSPSWRLRTSTSLIGVGSKLNSARCFITGNWAALIW